MKGKVNQFSQDKHLPNILILPAYPAINVRQGNYLGDRGTTQEWNSKKWSDIEKNKNPRFHYINQETDFQVPDLAIDF